MPRSNHFLLFVIVKVSIIYLASLFLYRLYMPKILHLGLYKVAVTVL